MAFAAGNIFIISKGKDQVSLATAPSTGGIGVTARTYKLQRADDSNNVPGAFSDLGIAQAALTWGDPSVVSGNSYWYQIVYTSDQGDSVTGSMLRVSVEPTISYTMPRHAESPPWRKSKPNREWI